MARDYYSVLGVPRDAGKEDIKQAYRRLARQYHPDVNKESGAEERFKEINRAYEILSEPESRARYDRFGEAGVSGAAGGASGYQDFGDVGGIADIFETFFGGFGGMGGGSAAGSRRRSTGPARGDDLRLDLKLSFRDAVAGGEREIDIPHAETCRTCEGSGAKPGSGITTCSTCGGSGQVRRATRTPFGSFAQVSTCPTCGGAGRIIEEKCETCGGTGREQVTKKLKITIPPGVDNGIKLRVSGEGDAGLRGGSPGDLYVYLFVEEDANFKRDGIDVRSTLSISYLQAILGCKTRVETVDGTEEILTVPAGTQPNTVLKLEGFGIPRLGNAVSRGDHLVEVRVEIPGRLSPEERELLEKIAELKGDSAGRGGGREGFLGGLFR